MENMYVEIAYCRIKDALNSAYASIKKHPPKMILNNTSKSDKIMVKKNGVIFIFKDYIVKQIGNSEKIKTYVQHILENSENFITGIEETAISVSSDIKKQNESVSTLIDSPEKTDNDNPIKNKKIINKDDLDAFRNTMGS